MKAKIISDIGKQTVITENRDGVFHYDMTHCPAYSMNGSWHSLDSLTNAIEELYGEEYVSEIKVNSSNKSYFEIDVSVNLDVIFRYLDLTTSSSSSSSGLSSSSSSSSGSNAEEYDESKALEELIKMFE